MVSRGVIVTDGDERSALAITRSLRRRDILVYVGVETPASLSETSRYCTQSFVYPSPWSDPQGYVSCPIDAIRRWDVRLGDPVDDQPRFPGGRLIPTYDGAASIAS